MHVPRWLVATVFVFAAGTAADAAETTAAPAERLVDQLGSNELADRNNAELQLLKISVTAIPALEQGTRNTDREVRYRCERIILTIREWDMDRRLEAFLHHYDPNFNYGFPAFDEFREQFGQTQESRLLYVDMLRSESD